MTGEQRELVKRALDQRRRELMADAIAAERRSDLGPLCFHGTEGGYSQGCRCDECRTAASVAKNRRRQADLEGQRRRDREYKQRRRLERLAA